MGDDHESKQLDWDSFDRKQRDLAIQYALMAPPKSLEEINKEAVELHHALHGIDPRDAYHTHEERAVFNRFMDHYAMAQTLMHYPDSHLAQHYMAKYPEFAQQIGQAIEQHRSKQIGHDQGFGY